MDARADLAHIAPDLSGAIHDPGVRSRTRLARAVIVAGGVLAGFLAGLFGIGGARFIVPGAVRGFRVIGVHDDVRMQLCVGTSLAHHRSTTIRSYVRIRARRGLRRAAHLDVPMVAGVALGALVGDLRAEAGVQDRVHRALPASSRCACSAATDCGSATPLPGRLAMIVLRSAIGLASSLMGVSGGRRCLPWC